MEETVGTAGSRYYTDEEAWQEYLDQPLCTVRGCQSATDHGKPIVGRIWSNGDYHMDAFPDDLRRCCFTCAFWIEHLLTDGTGSVVVAQDGRKRHYAFDVDHPILYGKGMRGFGGRKFTVNFTDGRQVTTNNLWYQGEIPSWLEGRFTVNAVIS